MPDGPGKIYLTVAVILERKCNDQKILKVTALGRAQLHGMLLSRESITPLENAPSNRKLAVTFISDEMKKTAAIGPLQMPKNGTRTMTKMTEVPLKFREVSYPKPSATLECWTYS